MHFFKTSSFNASFGFLVIASLLLASCSKPLPQEQLLNGRTMGTSYSVKFVPVEGVDTQKLHQQIDAKLKWVNDLMSTWQDDSELSQFNQLQSTEPFTVSPEVITVIKEAQRLNKLSNGAYDVTAGKVFSLWGFDKQARPEKVPTTAEVTIARAVSGMDKLSVIEGQIQKSVPELYVNLSSIAKGYGSDVLAELLESNGITNYLVEIGGETRLAGLKADGSLWRMAIEKPIAGQRSVQRVIELTDIAMATSGDYRIYFEEDGVRYSHLIDPRTAKPITHNLVSVTVLHPSSMTADGLATLFTVLGAKQALSIAEQQQIPVLLITKEADGYKESYSGAMKQFLN